MCLLDLCDRCKLNGVLYTGSHNYMIRLSQMIIVSKNYIPVKLQVAEVLLPVRMV